MNMCPWVIITLYRHIFSGNYALYSYEFANIVLLFGLYTHIFFSREIWVMYLAYKYMP